MAEARVFVGIDVAKAELVVAVRPEGTQWNVPLREAGWAALALKLQALALALVLLEATGGLESPVAGASSPLGFPGPW